MSVIMICNSCRELVGRLSDLLPNNYALGTCARCAKLITNAPLDESAFVRFATEKRNLMKRLNGISIAQNSLRKEKEIVEARISELTDALHRQEILKSK